MVAYLLKPFDFTDTFAQLSPIRPSLILPTSVTRVQIVQYVPSSLHIKTVPTGESMRESMKNSTSANLADWNKSQFHRWITEIMVKCPLVPLAASEETEW